MVFEMVKSCDHLCLNCCDQTRTMTWGYIVFQSECHITYSFYPRGILLNIIMACSVAGGRNDVVGGTGATPMT
jgi:hypothetical protein